MAETPGDEEVAALGRAVVYRLLSQSFRYPDAESRGATVRLARAAREVLGDGTCPSSAGLVEALATWAGRYEAADPEAIEGAHLETVGHAPQGASPAYEAEYGEGEEPLQMPHELGDLAGFYQAFGLKVGHASGERVDFVGVQLEFMDFLCRKEAYGHETGAPDLAKAARDAQILFLSRHLGRWVPAFCRRVLDRPVSELSISQASVALAWVEEDCARLGVEPGTDKLRLRQDFGKVEACVGCEAPDAPSMEV